MLYVKEQKLNKRGILCSVVSIYLFQQSRAIFNK